MKEIHLTQGQVALVDDEDFEYLNQWKWCARWDNTIKNFYCARTEGKKPHEKPVYMHREIMHSKKGEHCDHINHNTLDNQKHNLRNTTPSQSSMNRTLRSDNKLREKCIYKYEKGYRVQVKVLGKSILDKYFSGDDALIRAISARNEAIGKYHGEFGWVNNE